MNIDDTKRFLLAGRAIITIQSTVTEVRFTYKISKADFADDTYFVGLLSGPDNIHDYTYMGMLHAGTNDPSRWYMRQTGKSKVSPTRPSWLGLAWFLGHMGQGTTPPKCMWWHEGQCGACGRKLTVPESIERGIGPVCAGMQL